MQTSLNKFFNRLEELAKLKGFSGIPELSKALGYHSPEKLYRLGRKKDAKPSVDILIDLSNKFDSLNLKWFLTGKGSPENDSTTIVLDPDSRYETLEKRIIDIEKRLKSTE